MTRTTSQGPRRGLVIGCGGTVGGAWTVGALSAAQDELGWDLREAEVIVGTSSGSSIAAMLGSGYGVADLVAAQRADVGAPSSLTAFFTRPPALLPRLPIGLPQSLPLVRAGLGRAGRRRRSPMLALSGLAPAGRSATKFLTDLATALQPNGGWPERTRIVAVDTTSGHRVAFGDPGAPIATLDQALRASWAVPGWYPPVRIGERSYFDGGVVSPMSADRLADLGLDEVLVVAPMVSTGRARVAGLGGRAEALMRRPMSRTASREVVELQRRGTRVLRVHPGYDDLAIMGPNFMNPKRRVAAFEAGLRVTPGLVDEPPAIVR